MSRLQVPLQYRTLWASGDVLLRPEINLLLKTNRGTWEKRTFLVDSGSEMTTMSAFAARQLDLPLPQAVVPGIVHQPTGLRFRSGYLRVRVVGMDATEYAFPCFFLGDPNAAPAAAPPHTIPRRLLGLSGVVDKLRITLDGDPSPTAIYGYLIVEKK